MECSEYYSEFSFCSDGNEKIIFDMPRTDSFFDEITEQSKVKLGIVTKYFDAWARVMVGSLKRAPTPPDWVIAYVDLFCGPGKYDDGTKSTPLLVIEKAIKDSVLRERLITLFNDKDERTVSLLEKELFSIPGIDSLRFRPTVSGLEVSNNILTALGRFQSIPTLFFVDPWGYKGLSVNLIGSLLTAWGSDVIFFFNYKRINMGLNNTLFKENIDSLFGTQRAAILRDRLGSLSVQQRELAILEELWSAFRDLGFPFVLPFCFKDDRGTRTSHHLVFVSKAFKGYEIMKEIMASECSGTEQGVPSFEYNPIEAQYAETQPLLFELARPIDDLREMLLREFAGESLTMKEIYKRHNIGRRFIKKNYKEALLQLEKENKIFVKKHKRNSFGDDVSVTFLS